MPDEDEGPKSVQDIIAMIMSLPPETPVGEIQGMLATFQTEGPAVEPVEQSRALMANLADRKSAPSAML
jgi:hypothetical protein